MITKLLEKVFYAWRTRGFFLWNWLFCVKALVKLCWLSLTPANSSVAEVETVGETKTGNHLCFCQWWWEILSLCPCLSALSFSSSVSFWNVRLPLFCLQVFDLLSTLTCSQVQAVPSSHVIHKKCPFFHYLLLIDITQLHEVQECSYKIL